MYYLTNRNNPGIGALPTMSMRELDRLPDQELKAIIATTIEPDIVGVPVAATPQVSTPIVQKAETIMTGLKDYLKVAATLTPIEREKYITRLKLTAGPNNLFANAIRNIKPVAITPPVDRPVMSSDPVSDNQVLFLRDPAKVVMKKDYAMDVVEMAKPGPEDESGFGTIAAIAAGLLLLL